MSGLHPCWLTALAAEHPPSLVRTIVVCDAFASVLHAVKEERASAHRNRPQVRTRHNLAIDHGDSRYRGVEVSVRRWRAKIKFPHRSKCVLLVQPRYGRDWLHVCVYICGHIDIYIYGDRPLCGPDFGTFSMTFDIEKQRKTKMENRAG